MRVTDKMVFDRANATTALARERAEKAAIEATAGSRIGHPGDDPGASGQLVAHRQSQMRFEAIGKGAQRALDELNVVDNALESVLTITNRAHHLAIQLGNDTYSAEDRKNAASEVNGLFRDLVTVLNAKMGNQYVLGGYRDDTPPFDSTGAYSGTGVRQVEVAPGQLEPISVDGDTIARGAGYPGGVDLFATLTALSTALASGSGSAIRDQIGALDTGINQVIAVRSQAGSSVSLFELSREMSRTNEEADEARIASLSEVDIFKAATQLAQAQRGLEAALEITARSFQLTLVGKMR